MSNPIKLPSINIGTAVIPSTAGLRLVADIDIRARDLEVVRVVWEAARRVIDPTRYANEADRSVAWGHYHAICALEFTHG